MLSPFAQGDDVSVVRLSSRRRGVRRSAHGARPYRRLSRGGLTVSGGGLVEMTGGRLLAHENSFPPFAEAIWRDAGHYYLLGYWPTSPRDLHSIDVRVSRKGADVHARRAR